MNLKKITAFLTILLIANILKSQTTSVMLLYNAVSEFDYDFSGTIEVSEAADIDNVMFPNIFFNPGEVANYRYELQEIANYAGYDFNITIHSSNYNILYNNGTILFPFGTLSIVNSNSNDEIYVKQGDSDNFHSIEVFSDLKKINSDKHYYSLVQNCSVDTVLNTENFWVELGTVNHVEFAESSPFGISFNLENFSGIRHLDISDHNVLRSSSIFESTSLESVCVFKDLEHLITDYTSTVTISSKCGSNAVNIIDDNLLTFLISSKFNTDLNGTISYDELILIDSLDISDKGISTLSGLKPCENLTYLDASDNNLDTIKLENFPKLEYLNIAGNDISTIDFSGDLVSDEDTFDEVTPTTPGSALDTLIIDNNGLTSLDVSELNLSYLSAVNNPSLDYICVSSDQMDNDTPNWDKDASTEYSVGCSIISSTNEIHSQQNIIYPNPTTDFISFSNSLVSISNIEGKIIFENKNTTTLNVTQWAKGIYFAQFDNGEKTKLVIK